MSFDDEVDKKFYQPNNIWIVVFLSAAIAPFSLNLIWFIAFWVVWEAVFFCYTSFYTPSENYVPSIRLTIVASSIASWIAARKATCEMCIA